MLVEVGIFVAGMAVGGAIQFISEGHRQTVAASKAAVAAKPKRQYKKRQPKVAPEVFIGATSLSTQINGADNSFYERKEAAPWDAH